jgi:hypothetical protein
MNPIQRSIATILYCPMFSFAAEPPVRDAVKYSGGLLDALKRAEDLGESTRLTRVPPDGPIGRIDILRVGISSVILEGSDQNTLALSVGHVFRNRATRLRRKRGTCGSS